MCEDCQAARNLHSPTCAQCFGRLVRAIKALPIAREAKTERMQAALKEWMDWGHSEAELRRHAQGAKEKGRASR